MEEISTLEKWTTLRAQSPGRPVIILKHSMTCPVSIAMFYRIEEAELKGRYCVPVHMVAIQRSYELARQIAADLAVEHATPQVILMHNNRAVYHASHFEIDPDALARALHALPPPVPLPPPPPEPEPEPVIAPPPAAVKPAAAKPVVTVTPPAVVQPPVAAPPPAATIPPAAATPPAIATQPDPVTKPGTATQPGTGTPPAGGSPAAPPAPQASVPPSGTGTPSAGGPAPKA